MTKLTLILTTTILATGPAVQAQGAGHRPLEGDIQAYSAPWRYQHRDWSSPRHPLDPGICWYRNDYTGEWIWKC